jgi:hypothetical protein
MRDLAVKASGVLRRRGILTRVATKPFSTNYRIPFAQGYMVLNGDQITKIEAIQQRDAFGMVQNTWSTYFLLVGWE